jgi:hypothetical protein
VTAPLLFFCKTTENQLAWIALLEREIFFRFITNFCYEAELSNNKQRLFNFVSALSSEFAVNHSFAQSQHISSAAHANLHILINLLHKREFFFRSLMINRNISFFLPNEIRVTPSNPLIATFRELDNFALTHGKSHDMTFTSLSYPFLWKDQYRPMRRGINSLLRLQATGAIAIPSEIRLQILASSKDVIHSWAVPSAGVKIDCVPGYSSHKIFIFLLAGIYWGQCMEICGRYHH